MFVGQNLRYEVGTVSYRTPGSPRSSGSGDNTVVVAVVIVVCVLVLLIGLAAVVGIFIVIRRRSWITGYMLTHRSTRYTYYVAIPLSVVY